MRMVMKKKLMPGLRETVGQGSKFGATFRGAERVGQPLVYFAAVNVGRTGQVALCDFLF